MLRKYLWMTAAMGICLAGCQEDALVEEQTQTSGVTVEGEIVFSTSGLGSFNEENPQSRTVYGQGYEENGKWNCPVNRITGDQVRIYYPNASSPAEKYADYEVTWDDTNKNGILDNSENDAASLVKIGEPLCWGDGTEHAFYGFYPASVAKNSANPSEITGEIPMLQEMKEWKQDGNGNWTGEPDMNYAFMRAVTTVSGEGVGEPVSLRFEPLTTAIQVELTASDKLDLNGNGFAYLTSINILAENKDKTERQSLCGGFTMNLETGDVTLTSENTNNYQVTIDTRIDGSPMELKPNKKVTFTAFLLPGADENGDRTIKNLKIRVSGFGVGAARVKTFEGANIAKGTISKVTLSEYTPGTGANNWMAALDDNVRLSQLSLPGSVNAFTRDIFHGLGQADPYTEGQETDITQSILVGDQFKAGVRVFEIATEKNGDSQKDNLEDAHLVAGATEGTSNYNLSYAFQNLAASVASQPSEFVIAIPYYDPSSTSKPGIWVCQLYNYLASLNGNIGGVEIIPFDGNTTVEEARGKILVLTRIPGDYDDLQGWFTSYHSLGDLLELTSVVYNWDLEKDRWWNRGYNVKEVKNEGYGGIYPDMWKLADEKKKQWYWTGKQAYGDNHKSAEPTNISGYDHSRWENKVGIYTLGYGVGTYHVFDWERVCESEGRYAHTYNGYQVNHAYSTYWYESMKEKIKYTKDFMDEGISALKTASSGDDVYINSLRGYYIVSVKDGLSAASWTTSDVPDAGRHGDVPSYTQDINEEIYKYINDKKPNERGPLGIMLMNFSGAGNAYPGMDMHGDDLLQTIIDNNFRFLLNTSRAE